MDVANYIIFIIAYESHIFIIFIIVSYHYPGSFPFTVQSSTIVYFGECHSSRTVEFCQEPRLISSECFICELPYITDIGHCIYLTGMNGFCSYIKCR